MNQFNKIILNSLFLVSLIFSGITQAEISQKDQMTKHLQVLEQLIVNIDSEFNKMQENLLQMDGNSSGIVDMKTRIDELQSEISRLEAKINNMKHASDTAMYTTTDNDFRIRRSLLVLPIGW